MLVEKKVGLMDRIAWLCVDFESLERVTKKNSYKKAAFVC